MTIRTHKAKVVELSAQRNGWNLDYKCTDQCAMDSDVVLEYAWNYTCDHFGIVRQFIDLALDIAPKLLTFSDCWDYAAKQHGDCKTDKNWLDFNHTLCDWYIVKNV